MVKFSASFAIKGQENLNPERYSRKIQRGALRAMDRTMSEASQVAQDYYMSKRKSTNPVSKVVDSFSYNVGLGVFKSVVGIVTAGGSKAPHAIYVDQPRRLRDGKMWPGYNFMEVGYLYAIERFPVYMRYETMMEIQRL